jgi:hypothetical protein
VNRVENDAPRVDQANDPRLFWLLFLWIYKPGEVWMTGVPAGQCVEMLDRTIDHQLCVATDLDESCRVPRVDDEEADPGVVFQVASLLALQGRVHPRARPVVVHPDQAGVGLAIPPHGGDNPTDRTLQQIQM